MKEFLADFQVDTEHKEIAGVCAGIARYFNVDPLMIHALAVLLFLSSIEISLLTVISYAFLAGWMGNESLEVVIKKSGYKILFFYLVSILLNSFGDQNEKETFITIVRKFIVGWFNRNVWCYLYESSFKHFSRASTVYFDDHLFLSGNTIDNSSSLFYHE